MRRSGVVAFFVLSVLCAEWAHALDLSFIERAPISDKTFFGQPVWCRADGKVCYVVSGKKKVLVRDDRERFWSKTNALMGGAMLGAITLDLESYYKNTGKSRPALFLQPNGTLQAGTQRLEEVGLLMKPFVKHRAGAYSAQLAIRGTVLFVGWKLRRMDQKVFRVLGYLLSPGSTADQIRVAKRNLDLGREFDRTRDGPPVIVR